MKTLPILVIVTFAIFKGSEGYGKYNIWLEVIQVNI